MNHVVPIARGGGGVSMGLLGTRGTAFQHPNGLPLPGERGAGSGERGAGSGEQPDLSTGDIYRPY